MKIAIMGATGAVGREMLNSLIEQEIEVDELVLLASKNSAGTKIKFKDKEIEVEELTKDSFTGCDIVLGAASNAIAKEYAPYIVKAGAVFIDNSSAFRMDPDVPLVVPEINGADALKHKGIIANPNCSTIIACMAVNAINAISPIKRMVASTYQAVSGAGKHGIDELNDQIDALSNNSPVETKVFPYQIAYNVIPCIGTNKVDDYTTEEMKMENEGRKIMHLDDLVVSCTCVRVPVMRSHSIAISLQCEKPLNVEEVKEVISKHENTVLYDDLDNGIYPMPLLTSNQNKVYVGRIRKDRAFEGGINLFCCGDQIRKGAAANAVQIIKCIK